MPRILLDVDGPLTRGFFSTACAVLRGLGVDADPEKIDRWDILAAFNVPERLHAAYFEMIRQPGVATTFGPNEGALEFLEGVRAWADVYAVTSPLVGAPTWAHEREEWLINHLKFDRKHIIHAHDKTVVDGDVLVDDRFATVEAWYLYRGGEAILWREPHNRKDDWFPDVYNYDELKRFLAQNLGG